MNVHDSNSCNDPKCNRLGCVMAKTVKLQGELNEVKRVNGEMAERLAYLESAWLSGVKPSQSGAGVATHDARISKLEEVIARMNGLKTSWMSSALSGEDLSIEPMATTGELQTVISQYNDLESKVDSIDSVLSGELKEAIHDRDSARSELASMTTGRIGAPDREGD